MDLNADHVATGLGGILLGWLTKLLHGAMSARAQFQKVVDGQEAIKSQIEGVETRVNERFTLMEKRMDAFAEEQRYQRRLRDQANGQNGG